MIFLLIYQNRDLYRSKSTFRIATAQNGGNVLENDGGRMTEEYRLKILQKTATEQDRELERERHTMRECDRQFCSAGINLAKVT